jgi:phage terminase large subunit GpA-like protein
MANVTGCSNAAATATAGGGAKTLMATPVSPPSTHPAENERRLSRGRSIRFSDSLEPVWFEQLCSERKVLRYVRGLPCAGSSGSQVPKAEALDCLVYAFAARQGVTIHADTREDELRQLGAPKPMPRVIRSA